MIKFIYYRT